MQVNLTKGSIKEHIKALAIPSSIGYFFHTMFNVTDTYFAGEISTEAIASLSLSFSIFFTIIAISGGMSQGVGALLGNAMGEKNMQNTKQILVHAFFFALFLAFFVSVFGLASVSFFLEKLGATEQYLATSYAYISVIIMGALFFVGVMFANALLNSIGNTKAFRNFLVIGFFANIVLDYWFVHGGFGLEAMGVRGIAFATVIIECFGMIYLVIELFKTNLLRDLPPFAFDGKIFVDIFKQGFPATINMMLMALGMFVITYFIAPFGQHVVAAYGVALRIEQIILLPSIGLNVAVLSIVSQNNGAKEYDRVKQTRKEAQKIGFIMWMIGIVFLLSCSKMLVTFFTHDPAVIDAAVDYLYMAAFALYAYVLVFINISLLQGIKQPALLVYLSLLRQLLVPVVIFTLFAYFELPLLAYWIGIGIFIWVSALFILWYAGKKLEKLN